MASTSGVFRQALDAIQQGNRARAREILTRLLKDDKNNPEYWLWLSAAVESDKERLYCLQTVLRLDPGNPAAQRGLRLLGQSQETELPPLPPPFRKWEAILQERTEATAGRTLISPRARRVLMVSAAVVVFVIAFLGMFGTRLGLIAPHLTITPIAWTPTFTPVPTETPTPAPGTPTPEPTEILPLWMSLEATYTPRPPYVTTPHPRSEAFRIAMRAYQSGDYEKMLEFLRQVEREEPEAADIAYYIGEAHRLLGEYEAALQAYQQALQIDPNFAPAYYARAQAAFEANPEKGKSVEQDYLKAIEIAPDFADAYIALARYYLYTNDLEAAHAIIEQGGELLNTYPEVYFIRAQAALAAGELEQAAELAQQAYQMDITALPTYLLLAEIAVRRQDFETARQYLDTYGLYEQENPRYWALLAAVYYEQDEDYQAARQAAEKALQLDENTAMAHQYLGLAALETGDTRTAIDELFKARNLDPQNFDISMGFGLAMWAGGDVQNAYLQVDHSEELAQNDAQLAQVYYYRAQLAHLLSQFQREELDWQALLDLPAEVAPEEWRQEARVALGLITATPTITPTATVPTATPTPTRTPTETSTPGG